MDPQLNSLLAQLGQSPTEDHLQALRAYCQQSGNVAALASGLATFAHAQPDPARAAEALVEAGGLQLHTLHDPRAARPLFERALQLWPTYRPALDGSRGALHQLGDYEALAAAMEGYAQALADVEGDPFEIGALHLELGHLYRDRFERLDRAVAHYRAAVDFDASQREALRAAREIYKQAGKWDSAAKLLELEAESYPDGQKKAVLLVELASLYRDRLRHLPQAQHALEEAARCLPEDLGVKHQLALLHLDQADLAPGTPEARAHYDQGADILTTMAEAVDDAYAVAYTEAALDAAPAHPRAMAAFEGVARRTGREAAIAGRWQRSLEASPTGPDARRVRLALGAHYLEAGRQAEARACLDPLLRAGDPDARTLVDPSDPPEALDEAALEPLSEETSLEQALVPLSEEASLEEGEPARLDEEGDSADDSATDAADETNPVAPLTKSDAAKALSASLEEALSDADLEEMTGERTPVSMVPPSELARLHEALHAKLRAEDRAGAAEVAREVLERAPMDPTALTTLEDYYRTERHFEQLRDLVLHLSRQVELPVDARIQRLREAAFLSENRLDDVQGTTAALNAVLALVPTDEVARGKLRAIYEEHERHDELAQLLEREAATLTDPAAQIAAYRELVSLHRDKRHDLEDALDALSYLRDLEPEVSEHEDALADLLVQLDRTTEAVPLLEARLLRTEEPEAKWALSLQLADVYEHELQEPDKAYGLISAAFHIRPEDDALLDRMLALDETLQRHDRLVDDLIRKLPRLEGEALAETHTRIATLAADKLGDMDLACTHRTEALKLTPGDAALWDAARGVFEQSGRDEELNALLQSQAEQAASDEVASLLWRRLSARRATEGNLPAAIDALHRLAERTPDDLEVQTELVDLLEQHGARPEDLLDQLARLIDLTTDETHRRELRMRRVELLRGELVEPRRAREELLELVDEQPDDEDALRLLTDLCSDLQDDQALSSALLRRLGVGSVDSQLEVAEQLTALAEGKMHDADLARTALRAWVELSPGDPIALARLLPHLEDEDLAAERLETLDALAAASLDEEESVEHTLAAASVAEQALGDIDGAWRRLAYAVVERGHAAAELPLRELAERAGRGAPLAEIQVSLAQRAPDGREKLRRWMDAAESYEKLAGNEAQALEATLRALALDLENPTLLDEADRLAAAVGAWDRLSKVYDSLTRKAQDRDARVRLLTRHAGLLEDKAGLPEQALDRLIAACALSPLDDALLERALGLAERTDRDLDILPVYERRAELATAGSARARELLSACSLAHRKTDGQARSHAYLRRALREAIESDDLLDALERTTQDLDQLDPPMHGEGLVDGLAEAYTESVETSLPTPERAANLLRRAARLTRDPAQTTRTLMRAFELAPADAELLDELTEAAGHSEMREELAQLLRKTADDAIDSETASLALRRLGSVLTDGLDRPRDAADVFKQLVLLRPADVEARARLRECLRAAERHQDLLVAIDQQLMRADDAELRVELLREAARCWQDELGNRFEAREAWQKLLAEAPDDTEAQAALEALGRQKRPSQDDGDLLESGLQVLPEDLTYEAATTEDEAPAEEAALEPAEVDEAQANPAEAEAETQLEAVVETDVAPGADAEAKPQPEAADTSPIADAGPPSAAEDSPVSEPLPDGPEGEAAMASGEPQQPTSTPEADPESVEHALDAEALIEELDEAPPGTGVYAAPAASRPPSMPPPPPPPSVPPPPPEPLEDPMEALARLAPSDDEPSEDDAVAVEESSVVGPEHAAPGQDDLDALSALVGQDRPRKRSVVPPPPRGRGHHGTAPPTPSQSPSVPGQATGGRSVPPPPPKRR